MKRSAAGAVLPAITLAASACAGSHRASVSPAPPRVHGTPISAKTVTSSRLIRGGRVRCTVTIPTRVEVGQRIGNTFAFRNVSGHPVRVYLGGGSLVVRAGDGTTYDTNLPHTPGGGVPVMPTPTRPGGTKTMQVLTPRVRWSGPLRITPRCWSPLPVVRVHVLTPGPPPSERAAVAKVVAASGFVLRRCRPRTPGVAVRGEIESPGGGVPPLQARCSVGIQRERGFLVAQVLVVTPPRRQVRIRQPYEELLLPGERMPYDMPLRTPPFEAIAWEFVVTRLGASSVAFQTIDADNFSHRRIPTWTWTGSRWKAGTDSCGYKSFYGGAVAANAFFEFISGCRS